MTSHPLLRGELHQLSGHLPYPAQHFFQPHWLWGGSRRHVASEVPESSRRVSALFRFSFTNYGMRPGTTCRQMPNPASASEPPPGAGTAPSDDTHIAGSPILYQVHLETFLNFSASISISESQMTAGISQHLSSPISAVKAETSSLYLASLPLTSH